MRKKEGYLFFIALLTISGIVIVFLGAFFLKGKSITLFAVKQFVINKAFVSLLPKEYSLEKTEAIRKQVYDFFDTAEEKQIDDMAVMQVSQKIQAVMADDRIVPEEVTELIHLIEEKQGTPSLDKKGLEENKRR
jgi:hypothetical protein